MCCKGLKEALKSRLQNDIKVSSKLVPPSFYDPNIYENHRFAAKTLKEELIARFMPEQWSNVCLPLAQSPLKNRNVIFFVIFFLLSFNGLYVCYCNDRILSGPEFLLFVL